MFPFHTTLLFLLSCCCAVCDCEGKADLSKGYWNPKRKLGVTTDFLEIIKQLF